MTNTLKNRYIVQKNTLKYLYCQITEHRPVHSFLIILRLASMCIIRCLENGIEISPLISLLHR